MLESKNCQPGQEQYEIYQLWVNHKWFLQYDYRTMAGRLYTKVIPLKSMLATENPDKESLETARRLCHYGE